jgi:tetratricopeptide (TPR) repeat protein
MTYPAGRTRDGSANRRRRVLRLGVAAAVVLTAVGFAWNRWYRPFAAGRYSRDAEAALQRGDADAALALAQRSLAVIPEASRALLVAGQAASAGRHNDDALAFWERVRQDDGPDGVQALFLRGELLVRMGRAGEAEECLRDVLRRQPGRGDASFILAFVLGAQGRSWECLPLMHELLRQERCEIPQLLLVGLPTFYQIESPQFVELCLRTVPDDPTPLLAAARRAQTDGDDVQSRALLEKIVATRPRLVEAQVRLGRLLLDASVDDFLQWHERLPAEVENHPTLWETRGLWAERRADRRGAARCFWEALRRDPNLLVPAQHLAQVLTALDETALAAPFERRAALLGRLTVPLQQIRVAPYPAAPLLRRISKLMEDLDRPWEADAWARLALRDEPASEWARESVGNLRPVLASDPPLTLPAGDPTLSADLSAWPLPVWPRAKSGPDEPPRTEASPGARVPSGADIRFIDDAAATGLEFRFANSADPPGSILRMHEFTGGGIAVIDYDGDLWPDVYCAQGATSFPQAPGDAGPLPDVLFRNTGDGRFVTVPPQAGLDDARFSQGVAVGDFDLDGFPDLYLGNIGPNRLYRNQGDGTFREVTAEARVAGGNEWTTSCVLADLNGDSLPDLYVVNYLVGEDLFERICDSDGRPRACIPAAFAAAQDRVYFNLGDGRFLDATDSAGISEKSSPGRGLGVVAFRREGDETLSLFVANDTDANFLLRCGRVSIDGARFRDEAIATGTAFSDEGAAQASMGIAAADADGDGLLDLFVTNFYKEGSTLYCQEAGGLFHVRTRQAALLAPSFLQLGFGAQFLDADLDGDNDLAVVNGHVYDERHRGLPFEMAPQVFRNDGGGRFTELPAANVGPYFCGRYLGRALARIDWNRDGRDDLLVGHLDAPLALLTNCTSAAGHRLSIHLRGRESPRDPVGAVVRIRAGGRVWTSQLTAGDGYLAANERKLTFGLGPAARIEEMSVAWPAGQTQTFDDFAADAEIVVIEGRSSLVVYGAP